MKATLYGLTKNKNDIHVKSQLEKMLAQVSEEGAAVIDGANIAAESIYGKSIVAGSIEATQIKAGAITSDHITTNGIVADKIKTGVLRSTNGASWLNLNDGTFSYANGNFTFQDGKMVVRAHTIELGGEEVPTKTQTEEYADSLGETLQGQIDTSIKSTEVEYYSSTSSTSPVGGSWSTTAPAWQEGRFVWSRTKITPNKGSVIYKPNATGTNISGATGNSAKIVTVTPSAQLFWRNQENAVTPATITVDGSVQNTTISAWQYSVDGGSFTTTLPTGVTRSGNKVSLTGATVTARTIAIKALDASGNTDTTTIAMVQDGVKGVDGSSGAKGENAIVGILTNESITVPASESGAVTSFAGATGTFEIYDGTTRKTGSGVTYSVSGTPSGITVSINATTGIYTISAMTGGTSVLSGNATLQAVYNGVTIQKILTVTKAMTGKTGATGSTGASGSDAKIVTLTSSAQIFAKNESGAISPSSITVEGVSQNTSITAWEYSIDGGTFSSVLPTGLSRTGNVVSITGSSVTAKSISLRAKDASGVSDVLSIAVVQDGAKGLDGSNGADAYTVVLSNEAHTFVGNTASAIASSVTVNVVAYKGATRVGATIGAISGAVTGMSTSIATNGTTTASFTVSVTTAMSATNGLLTIPITVDGKVFSKTFSFALALKGADGANGSAGADAKVIIVNPSAQIFTKDANGNVTPSTVTIDGTSQNVSISTWEYSTNGGAFSTTLPTGVTRSGNTVTITGASMTAKNISVRASGSGVSDTTTIAMVQDGIKGVDGNDGSNGADAYTVVLSNESHTFAGNISNALAGSTKIDVIAYKGNTRVGATIGTISGLPTAGMTAPISGNGGTTASFTVSATTSLTSPNGVLTVPITVDGKLFTKTFSYAISFKGQTGQSGQDGKGIQSTDVMYQNHTNGTTAPTGVWSSTVPAPVKGQYLWTRTITTYTDNSTIPTYSVAYSATDGENGVDGKGIVSTTVNYQLSSSGTVTPTGSWLTSVPTPVKGQYLWTRTVITYTSGTPSTSYSTSYYATDGQKGDKGDTGSAGADSKIVTVTPSAQIFARNAQGAITPSSITVDGTGQNTTISIWQYSVDGGTFATGLPTGVTRVGNQVTVNGSSMTAKTIAVKAIDSSGNSDTTTIAKVQDGSDGSTGAKGDNSIVGYLTNESVTLGASSTGVVSSFATASGTFRVFDGITEVTTNAACVFSLNSSTGVTLTINSSGVYTVTAMSADTATAEFKAVYKGITITKAMSLSKSRVGATGSQGAKGEDGKGISSAVVDYQNHTNGTTAPTGTWSSTIPTPVKGQYLWTRTITTYTDNSSIPTYAVSYNALDGQKGSDGATGVGVSSTSVHYQLSTSGSTTPTGTWLTSVPTPVKGQYLWTRTVVSYTNGTSSTAYSTSYYATDGQKGDKGDTGPKGPDGISPIVGLLTNESITLPASDAGVVSSFTGATGTLNVYEGTALRNAQATYSVLTQSDIAVSITQDGVYTVSAVAVGASVLSGTATLRAVYGGVTIDKILTVTKALAGPQGAPSITYSWVTSAGMSIDSQGNLRQSAGQNSAWTEQAYTNESYTGGAFLSFKAGVVGNNTMFGLNTDPATDSNYTSIDYAYYMNGTTVGIYESGTSRGSFGTYAVGDTFQIVYDGVNVKYYHAGVLDRTVAAPANLKLHIDSSFYNISAANAVTDIYFGPSGSVGATGSAGQNATTYWINASTNAIKKDATGTIVPSTITFSGFSKTGTANPVAYAGRFIIQTSTDGVSYTTAYTSSANQASYTYTIPATASFVKARYYLAGGTTVLLDEQTVPVLVDAEGINIGGRNLFTNSGNFQNTTNWSGVNIAYEGGVPYLTGSGTLTNIADIPLEPGVEYVFTAKLRFNIAFPIASSTPNHIYIRYPGESAFSALDGATTLISNETQTIPGQWHVISLRFKTKPDTSKIPGLKFHAYTNTTPSVKDILWVKLEKGNKPTDWTPAPEDVELTQNKKVYNPVRYIRDWLKGSSANTSNHWCEIMANDTNGANVAQGKTVTTNGTASNLSFVTDGLANISYGGTGIGKHYVEIDLGSVYYNIASISTWHYYQDNRTYYETRTEVSEDGVNWYPLFDSLIEGEYAETADGRVFPNTKAKSESLISALNTAQQLANTTSKVVINGGNITAGSIKDKNSRNTINLDNGTFTLANGNIIYNGSTLEIKSGVSFSTLDSAAQTKINNGETAKSTLDSKASTWDTVTGKATPAQAQGYANTARDEAKEYVDKTTGNLVNNPAVTGVLKGWSASGLSVVNREFEGVSTQVIQSSVSTDTQNYSDWIDVDPSKAYEVSMWLQKSASAGMYYVGLNGQDSSGANVGFVSVNKNGVISSANNTNFYFQSGAGSTSWIRVVGYIMPVGTNASDMANIGTNDSLIMKQNTSKIRIRFLNWSNAGTTRQLWVANPKFVEVDPNAVMYGATAKKTVDDNKGKWDTASTNATNAKSKTDAWTFTGKTTINGGQIEADTITAAQIKAGSITAELINSDAIVIGSRNYFTKNTTAIQTVANSSFSFRDGETPNGFRVTGNSSSNGTVRVEKVITSNGWWTVSFDVKGSQSVAIGVTVDICDLGATRVMTNSINTYERRSVSVNVTNYSESVYNFVDFGVIQYAHFWIDNIKVEKGNKATDWTPAPEDVFIDLETEGSTVINGGNITTGYISADFIKGGTIATDNLVITDNENNNLLRIEQGGTRELDATKVFSVDGYIENLYIGTGQVAAATTDDVGILSEQDMALQHNIDESNAEIASVAGKVENLEGQINALDTYMKLVDANLTFTGNDAILGNASSKTRIAISDTKMQFYVDNVEIARIENGEFEFLGTTQMGHHKITKGPNNITTFSL